MRRLAVAARAALGSGRVITVWSLAASFVLSVTVMVPSVPDPTEAGVAPALLAGWLCFAGGLLVVGASERAVLRDGTRASVVIVGMVLDASARPVLHDLWLTLFGIPAPPPEQLPFRILTNVVVWVAVLTAIAVVVDASRSLRAANALLAVVRREMDAAHQRGELFDARARAEVDLAVTDLRRRVDALRAALVSPSALRAVAEGFRSGSHALSERARAAGDEASGRPPVRDRRRDRLMLRLPAAGTVTVLYIACMLPYALRAATGGAIAAALVVAVAGGWSIDRICRLRMLRRRGAVGAFLALSALVGAALSIIAALSGAALAPAAVPLLAYVGLAAGVALCAGVLHRLRAEQERLASAIAADQRETRSATAAARAALRQAADVMHRDGQAMCVVFEIENPHPAADRLGELATRLDEIVDRVEGVFGAARTMTDSRAIIELAGTWSRALEVVGMVSERAVEVLDAHPDVAADAFDVAAEGLLNAAKHAGAGRTTLTVDTVGTAAGERLRVRVHTPRTAPGPVGLSPASRVGERGARLRAVEDGIVLESVIAVPDPHPVVSAEHPDGTLVVEP